MFGYAANETPEYMPTPIILARKLSRRLSEVRHCGLLPYLRPDGKTQVTVRYDDAGRPVEIEKVLISTRHQDGVESKRPEAPEDVPGPPNTGRARSVSECYAWGWIRLWRCKRLWPGAVICAARLVPEAIVGHQRPCDRHR